MEPIMFEDIRTENVNLSVSVYADKKVFVHLLFRGCTAYVTLDKQQAQKFIEQLQRAMEHTK